MPKYPATITANNLSGLDRVHFNIPGDGIPTINLSSGASQYRTLRDQIIIDPGFNFGWTDEQALEMIAEDECVEVTPTSVRMRKVVLDQTVRARAAKRAKSLD